MKDLYIKRVDKATAIKMILKHHYSHACNRAVELCLGIFRVGSPSPFFDHTDDNLMGVVIYNIPMGINTHKSIGDFVTNQSEMLELTRLWISDDLGKNTESWAISQSIHYIRKTRPEIKVLISYSDVEAGHKGGIYQATNWIYQGVFGESNKMYSLDGGKTWKHDKSLFNANRVSSHSELNKVLPRPFLVKTGSPKHRYLQLLGCKSDRRKRRKALKYPCLDYPKESGKHKEIITRFELDEEVETLESLFAE